MRLIDADMIIEGAEWCKKHSDKSDEMYFDEIIERVNSYPEINAIPVEWLKTKSNESGNPANIYYLVLKMWQKEQECK